MNKTVRIIIYIVFSLVVLSCIGGVIYYALNNKTSTDKADEFRADLIGKWTYYDEKSDENFGISAMDIDKSGVNISLLGVSAYGNYDVTYDKDSKAYTLNLSYKTASSSKVDMSYFASLNDKKDILTLKSETSNAEVYYVLESSAAASSTKATTTTEVDSTNTTSDSSDKATTVYNPGTDVFIASLKGTWNLTSKTGVVNGTGTGYTFADSGKLEVNLSAKVKVDGNYTVGIASDGRYTVTITYVSVLGVDFKNTYYASINNGELSLVQKGLESGITTFTYKKSK